MYNYKYAAIGIRKKKIGSYLLHHWSFFISDNNFIHTIIIMEEKKK